ncbi:helix-turn-helix and ligand-binding sensor domain-containing protein [Flavobacterium aquicola]|uniref:Regulatory LuxR family protein n=1 Tax=Flavobacterium aquicola TaxID=1682742 RepID=A0A3E0DWY2_9FLAO|nr:triple tyrosine motif-containing protein [Flavobacterium aquicola]REG90465.1 regulatory LuxR family protein [Flavobacterium aquicola]
MNFNTSIIYRLLFIFTISLAITAYSQVKTQGIPDIKNYKRTEYKGGTQNWDIDQDKNGNLYFANNTGLLKFNGTSWHKYSLPDNSAIRSLKVDNSGRIYVGGNNEFGYFLSDQKGNLTYHSLSKLFNKNKKITKNINIIWKIHCFEDEVIFQAFSKVFFLKKNKLRYMEAKNRFQFSFLINKKLYFQDKKLGLLNYSKGKFTRLKGTSAINNSEIWAVFPADSKLILATLENGLFIYQNNTIRPWQTEANEYIKKNSSLGGCMIKNKLLVFNTVLNGIIITDFNGKIIQHLNRHKGLQNNTILKSFEDNKNNLWLGLDNGITFITENSPFTFFDYSYNMSTVYASLVYKNTLYVATNQGLFYHSWNDIFLDEPFKRIEGTIAQAWNIQLINGQLLCASNNGALLIENNRVAKILDNKGYFGFLAIPDHPNSIIGESYNGFSIFEKDGNNLVFKNSVAGFEETTNTFETLIDENFLWLKKNPNLYQMKLSDDLKKFEEIKIHTKINDTYTGIGSIQRLKNKIYFQTHNHFYRYSKEQEIFFEDKKISLLFKNMPTLNTVIEDGDENIWYCFNETLGVLQKNKSGNYIKKQIPFSNLSGNLVNNYISINAVNPNNVFIGLTEGLAHYDFNISNNFITQPTVYIQSLSFPHDTIITGNLFDNSKNYNLEYSSNHVKFTFSSPIYENPQSTTYSYKLEPFEDNWSSWSSSSMKEYTNLKEGDYVMKVKVKNSYGLESRPDQLFFTISPPWYRHFLAYLFYIILAVVANYIIYNRIKLKIRKNKYYETIEQRRLYLEKESKIRKGQYELEKEIEKLKNDNLQIQILAKDKELVTNSLQVVKKNKVLNGILQKVKEIDIKALDEPTKFQVTKLNKSIVKEVSNDKSWKSLEKHIKNVHFDFLKRLKEKYPTISPRELDLATYLLMNMSTKEIAEILNISIGGVELARYRLRKKLGLNKKENLIGFLMSI